jgi:hypothetical protein
MDVRAAGETRFMVFLFLFFFCETRTHAAATNELRVLYRLAREYRFQQLKLYIHSFERMNDHQQ